MMLVFSSGPRPVRAGLGVVCSRRGAASRAARPGDSLFACSTACCAPFSKLLNRDPGKPRRIFWGRWMVQPGSSSGGDPGNAQPDRLARNAPRDDCQYLRKSSSFQKPGDQGDMPSTCPTALPYNGNCSTARVTCNITEKQAAARPRSTPLWNNRATPSARSNSCISSRSRTGTGHSAPPSQSPCGA
jgi:hypothetical protein